MMYIDVAACRNNLIPWAYGGTLNNANRRALKRHDSLKGSSQAKEKEVTLLIFPFLWQKYYLQNHS
jgi:hypothetical protein